ncbi:MAG: hypothetical protein IT342_11815 [Candidatus Melainabacteria bacterium]|nr:hypothetical protein [Candidatus Melainabacteria bacterium]
MKRRAVALSIFLAPSIALAVTVAAFGADPELEPCSVLQPGRLETAREIKTEADAFIIKGRDLSQRLCAQIVEAEKLRSEALKLQAAANRLSEEKNLLAQSTSVENKTAGENKTAVESKTAGESKTSGDATTPSATGDSKTGGDTKVGTDGNPAGETASDAKPEADKSKEEKLTGRASTLQTLPMPNIPLVRLKGPQLQQAIKQFNIDVEQFKIHAAEYNKHYNLFRSQIGECNAARSAFDQLHKKYEMHCTAYHLNNIPPPKLCPPMTASVAEANSIAGQLRSDQMRAMRAEGQLRQEETKLRELEGAQGAADSLVVKSAERDKRERDIAGKFGRLRQEYDLLEIERKTIEASKGAKATAPVARPYVSGKIKKGK